MKIGKDTVARFHYRLQGADGTQIESSHGGEPMAVLWGVGGVIPGVERALEGRQAGDSFQVSVPPEEGYGPVRELKMRLSKKHFPKNVKLAPGMTVQLQTDQGPRMVRVVKVGMSVVDVDGNHPLAGQQLEFAIDIVDVRAATPGEIAHRHVHPDGDHDH